MAKTHCKPLVRNPSKTGFSQVQELYNNKAMVHSIHNLNSKVEYTLYALRNQWLSLAQWYHHSNVHVHHMDPSLQKNLRRITRPQEWSLQRQSAWKFTLTASSTCESPLSDNAWRCQTPHLTSLPILAMFVGRAYIRLPRYMGLFSNTKQMSEDGRNRVIETWFLWRDIGIHHLDEVHIVPRVMIAELIFQEF